MEGSPIGSPRVASPSSRVKNNLQESISASKLYRDLSPTKVYSTGKEGAPTALPDLFKQKNALQALRPTTFVDDKGAAADDDAVRTPKLLQRLETLLEEKLQLFERLGDHNEGFAAAQLRTDAYRQVFDAFLHSFTTYRSLLLRIKNEYDVALDDALASLYDNVHMKAEMTVVKERMDTAIHNARSAAQQDAEGVRKEIADQLKMYEAQALQAEERCQAAEQEIQQCRVRTLALRQQVAELLGKNRELKQRLLRESSWGHSPELTRCLGQPP